MNPAPSSLSLPGGGPEAKERFPLALLSLTLGAFAIGMTEFVIMGLLPNVARDLNVSIPRAGQLITGYALGVAVGAPLLTILTHRLPQKKLLLLLMLIFILGNLAGVFAPTYGVLMASRLLTALAHGTFLGSGSIIATRLVRPEKRAGAVSLVLMGLTVANIVGVPFGTFVGQQLGWRASFGAIAAIGLLSLIGIAILIPVLSGGKSAGLAHEVRGVLNPRVLLTLAAGALGCGSLFTVFTYITPLLTGVSGFAESSVTWILVLFGIGVTLGNVIGGRLADWKLMPSLIVNFAVLTAVLALLTIALPGKVTAVAAVFVWGIAAFGILPGIQVRVINLAHEAPMLAATSNHSALNLGNAGGAFLGGWVIDHLGLGPLPLVGAAVTAIGLALTIAGYVWDRGRRADGTGSAV
ncbi:MFS transporter [Saccharibacillus sp. CPCC 101409]|uniref:MFS transporter n=1 Tax=Saccharibacillus sp. CPCC 101409 TaxID=3058041 RepID=UPI002671C9D9|nr:MFS transporter [Saccharibacillus sp. CPCC 101409]MDO3408582.1 MFS transporter [Saccharibacillus sp. CPCC 101409]